MFLVLNTISIFHWN